MKKLILALLFITSCFMQQVMAQPATYSVPFSIGRNQCGSGSLDSVYFFNYANGVMTNNTAPKGCKPVLKPKPFTINVASVSYNPRDNNMYYIWTDYGFNPPRSYIWRWDPLTCPAVALDTIKMFKFDIGGVTFDNDGFAWQLEFSASAPYKAYLRQLDFVTGTINGADTMDLIANPAGIGNKLYSVGSGDITMTPSGQMYFVFDNKLYTPDYQSWNNATHHIRATCIDSVRRPTGTTLVGLSYADGDLIGAYSPNCTYRKIDPITGDTAAMTYTYAANKGVRSSDMSQINSGIGSAKKVISVTATGTPLQYDVVYDIYVKNYGNVPLSSIQLTDNLASINGLINLSNVSAVILSGPPGLTLNPLFNGSTNTNLLNAGQALDNYPQSENNFTIRVSCRLSNILNGIVYNNSAIATATGFNSKALRDSSTNGGSPDLNQNDKPDDVGENQPTPFLITIAATTPACSALEQTLYTQNFGSGSTVLLNTLPASPSASTTFIGSGVTPLSIRRFGIATNSVQGDASNWVNITDHTGGVYGRMMLLNADAPANIMYQDTLPVSCSGQQYSLSFYAVNLANANFVNTCNAFGGQIYPKIQIRIRDLTTGLIITQLQTSDIVSGSWTQYGMKWIQPPGYTNLILELINAAPGGCGNDLALDDISYGLCDPLPKVTTTGSTGCINGSTTFNANLTDAAVIPGTKDYQWQVATTLAGPYTNVVGATAATYTIDPILAADTGKFYRVIIAAQGNIGIGGCQYISDTIKLVGKIPSIQPTGTATTKNNICAGINVGLSRVGGTLGTNANWKWYTGSCGGTLVGTGTSLTVAPAVTTTYYIRAEGDCNATPCQVVTVFINCNIDKDQDGIPDYVESYLPASLLDTDGDGISNAFDNDYAGFVDINNDYINDNFQADGDSDSDGILNYLDTNFPGRIDINTDGIDDRFDADLDGKINMIDLDSDNDGIPDVVEAGGVDTDGDGKIDNFTDTDNDGLSQNVDVNNTGARISGIGLGVQNSDNDSYANTIDLDSDNDGIPDVVEAGSTDANFDGKIDGFTDANGDGISDNAINLTALLKTGADGNNDGKADSYPNKNFDNDKRPNVYDVDSDMDGILDVIEAGYADNDFNGFIDGAISADGWSTARHGSALNLRNTDGRGKPDYMDIDADDDGIPDNIEGQTTAAYKFSAFLDTDSDGLDNNYDNVVGVGGRGVFLSDKDMDNIPDYIDLDSDSDGGPDIVEGNDFNGNGTGTDDLTTLMLTDADGDGLDDRFDIMNSATDIRGTSSKMGTGGSITGDVSPGTKSPVQKTTVIQTDRDWRSVGYVLDVQLLNFKASSANDFVTLDWAVITSFAIDHFEIERSIDNISYEIIASVSDYVALNELQHYGANDDIGMISSNVFYYRIKVVAANGQYKYSNVAIIKKGAIKSPVSVFPNPATLKFSVRFLAEQDGEVSLRLIDKMGRVVMSKVEFVKKGTNELSFNNIGALSAGVYTLQVSLANETTTHKLIIQHRL